MFLPQGKKMVTTEVMDVLISLTVVIISQGIHVLNHHVLLKTPDCTT